MNDGRESSHVPQPRYQWYSPSGRLAPSRCEV
jgi:hypothetical protein